RLLTGFFRRYRFGSANYSSSSNNVSQVEPLALVETSGSLHSAWDYGSTQIREEHHWELYKFLEHVREPESKYVVVIFSPTQLIEDEGQRPTNLAREMSRRGYRVIFAYWRWRKDQWRPQDRLDEGIFQIPIDLIVDRPDTLFRDFDGAQGIAFFEFPHPAFFGLMASANSSGWITVYDCVDDWQEFHRVGQANWYERNFEEHMAATTDAVYAVNERMADRIRSLGRESVEIVPNGFRWGIDQVDDVRHLTRGKVTLGYFGYLSGAWFDWKLIAEVARTEPEWRIYLIGYGGGPEGMILPPNVVLLGRKPQSSLASYAANWDLAIVPFKPERLAANADPIKIYEYLAMGLPVVSIGVYPPPGAERFVLQAEGVKDFIEKVEMASSWRGEGVEDRRAYLESCTWSHRVDAILGSVIAGHQRIAEKRALFTLKP
ncbi:MAG: glycosyltransferase, partial [Anaerolineales bacterium]|nr:glycosyltransferase [Anaerolineales bacterium]